MGALDSIVRSGKALYAGISQYSAEQTLEAAKILRSLGTPCLIHQPRYSMFDRWIETELVDVLQETGIGCIVFSPLAKGLLTNRYLKGIPRDSRAGNQSVFLSPADITGERLAKIKALNKLAQNRNQTLAQMAIAWVLRKPAVTSALVGTSRVSQIDDLAGALDNLDFTEDELLAIEKIIS